MLLCVSVWVCNFASCLRQVLYKDSTDFGFCFVERAYKKFCGAGIQEAGIQEGPLRKLWSCLAKNWQGTGRASHSLPMWNHIIVNCNNALFHFFSLTTEDIKMEFAFPRCLSIWVLLI